MKILLVDDSNADRKMFTALLTGGTEPWLRDVELVSASVVPPFSRLFEFDGMILDEQLPMLAGHEIAREIHALNWRFPVILLTGEPAIMPHDVLTYCDGVLSKQTNWTEFSMLNPLFGFRRWARDIARAKEAEKR